MKALHALEGVQAVGEILDDSLEVAAVLGSQGCNFLPTFCSALVSFNVSSESSGRTRACTFSRTLAGDGSGLKA